jgi:hypothetical protein
MPEPVEIKTTQSRIKKATLRGLFHICSLAIAAGSFVAFEHFRAQEYPVASGLSLLATAIFGLTPLRDVTRILFAIEGSALHLAHALGGLAFLGLCGSGFVSGTPLLTHVSQLLMQQNQSPTLQSFAGSLPQIEKLAKSGDASQALNLLANLVSKAEALGKAPPGTSARLNVGISLGIDALERATQQLAANPATAVAARDLRHRLVIARTDLVKNR